MTKLTREWITEPHESFSDIRFPLATLSPTSGVSHASAAVIAGMHPGEAAGLIAAQDLIRSLADTELFGTVKIVPIASIEAFYTRALQLSPVDERECHYMFPGNPEGSYSEHLIDLLFRVVRDVDVVIDLHGGELVQDLTPYVAVPWRGQEDELWKSSLELGCCFDVEFVSKRDVREAHVGLPTALLDEGIPNVWTEIGRNGLPEASSIKLQYDGVRRIIGALGILKDVPPLESRPVVVGPKHWMVFAEESGVWRAAISAGQKVHSGDSLGETRDEFGTLLNQYKAPGSGVIEYICTNPAINHLRVPHGNRWHQLLVQIGATEENNDDDPALG